MEYVNIIIATQIIFLFLVLYFKNDNYLNKLLACIILIPGITSVFNALDILNVLPNWLFGTLYFFIIQLAFLFAPLIFYYIYLLSGKRVSLYHPLFVTTGLIMAYGVYGAINFTLMPAPEQDLYVTQIKSGDFPLEILIPSLLFFIMQQFYFTLSAIKIYHFKKKVSQVLSSRSNLKIAFMQRFVTLTWSLNIATTTLYILIPMRFVEFVIIPIALFIILNFITYYAFKYQAIFDETTYKTFQKDVALLNATSNITQKIPHHEQNELRATAIQEYLSTTKAYLNPDYTIFDLSNDLDCPHHEVSSVINKEMRLNFSKLINNFRVEEAKTILKEKIQSLTIEGIGKMAGFKSRASFYRAFKDKTGKTPTEYIKTGLS